MRKTKRRGPPSRKATPKKDLVRFCGQHACQAIFRHRRDDIAQVYLLQELVKSFGDLLHWCAATRRPYRVVESADLDRLSASTHHEGICIAALPREVNLLDQNSDLLDRRESLVVYLDRVSNPHNVGTVLRNAAHFEVSAVVGVQGDLPKLSAALCRVAEGGAESVAIFECRDGLEGLRLLRSRGYTVLATSSHASNSVFSYAFGSKTVLVLGSEREGVSDSIVAECEGTVSIPGSGAVESLNIASASAVIIGEWYRQRQLGEKDQRISRAGETRRSSR